MGAAQRPGNEADDGGGAGAGLERSAQNKSRIFKNFKNFGKTLKIF